MSVPVYSKVWRTAPAGSKVHHECLVPQFAFFQHNNPVGISDRFEAVSDNDYRPPRNQGIDSLLHFHFIFFIRSICPAETDIILQRILKQIDILKNHGTMFH